MATVTNNVSQIGRGFVSNHTAIFTDATQESAVKKVDLDVAAVSHLSWAIDTAGYIILSWEGTPNSTFAVISGNGRWELGKGAFKKPTTSTGKILLTTVGFVSADTYTLVLQGALS